MLRWALAFFIVALIAALFGFGEIASGATWIAKILFVVFILMFSICFILGLVSRRPPPRIPM